MTHILAISSSPNPATSHSKKLIDTFIACWAPEDETLQVTHRDIGTQPPVHLDADTINAFYSPSENLTDQQLTLTSYSNDIIAEVEAADIIVIGAPMHNFGIPSALKAWIDHLARVGKTFIYTENGPKGLLTNKQVVVLGARGGNYSETSHLKSMDQQTPFLKTALGFVGLSEIHFIYAEGMASDQDGMETAKRAVDMLVHSLTAKQAA